MSSRNTAEAWLRVSEIRERERKLALARVHAEVSNARARLDAALDVRTTHLEEARSHVRGDALPAASLILISDALAAGRRQVAAAKGEVDALEAPLAEARAALEASTRARRVAAELLERRTAQDRKAREDRQQREADDRASRRSDPS